MKITYLRFAVRLVVRLFLVLVLFESVGIIRAQPVAADPDSPRLLYLPFVGRPAPAMVPQCVDCPKNIIGTTAHSLRIDGNNHPHLAYGNDHLYHAWHDGAKWNYEVVDPAPGVGYSASLAFDNLGHPGISYYDSYNRSLKLARYNGSSWLLQTVDSSTNAGYTSSLAFNNLGNPLIAYTNYNESLFSFRVKYTEWSGTAWTTFPVVDQTDDSYGTTVSLALDQSGKTHISYWTNNYPSPARLMYASWSGSAWILQTAAEGDDLGRNNALAFDNHNIPHIIYMDEWNGEIRYATLNGSTWSSENVYGSGTLGMAKNNPMSLVFDANDRPMSAVSLGESDPSTNIVWLFYKSNGVWVDDQLQDFYNVSGGWWPSVALDTSGKPHVSYINYNTDELHYASLTTWGQPDTWSDVVIDAGSQVGQGVSLAIDRLGNAHIAYMDLVHRTMKYATLTAGGWATQLVSVDGMKPAHGHALAVDSYGRPHIAYSDTKLKKIMYATLNGSTWTAEPVANDSGSDIEKYISLAIDTSDNPHISYYDQAAIDLKYAHKSGDVWSVSQVDKDSTGITGLYNSIAIDSSGKPHISYYNNYTNKLWYAHWNGSGWDRSLVDSTYQAGRYTSIAVDTLDHPHICYSKGGDYTVKYATNAGSGWSEQTLNTPNPGNTDSRYPTCSIKIGASNTPYVSYFDKLSRSLAIAHPTGGAWSSEFVDTNGDTGEMNSLAIFNGTPYIAYYHGSNKDLLFIMWRP